MAIEWRPMRPNDVRACVDIVSAHPVVGPRYGSVIAGLRPAWLKLLGQEAFRGCVFEEFGDSGRRLIGCGVSAFVSDDFLAELKRPPFVWAAPRIVKRILGGSSPLLSDKQVREANRNGGLNLLVWEGTFYPADFARREVLMAVFATFAELHRGFLLKNLISHSASVENFEAMLQSGGLLLNRDGLYVNEVERPIKEIIAQPHYLGLSRELALTRLGSWMSSLFIHKPPRFAFRPREQRLLLCALRGGTDEELSDELAVSLSAVKKTWLSIYERVAAFDVNIIPVSDHDNSERGKAKKQRLLAYLREHMEELRPASL